MNFVGQPTLDLQVGGTLVPDRHLYIERPEDGEVFDLLQRCEYVNILSSRQVGKSSLMMRAALKLRERGWRFAIVDLTSLGSPDNGEAYFKALTRAIASGLKLKFDVNAFWELSAGETPSQRFIRFFRETVLAADERPVAIFLDEIDSTLKFPFIDDLFTALRAMYNERTLVDAYRRLAFCLVGVATPDELIKDRRTTPYNVGRTLSVGDFDPSRDDLSPLAVALHEDRSVGERLLPRVLYWTGGHPFLTARLCHELRETGIAAPESVDTYVEQTYATLEKLGEDVHIQQILRFLAQRLTDSAATLKLYRRILGGAREKDQPTLTHAELKLSGLVKRDAEGCLAVRNRIYARLFGPEWVRASAPERETRRYKQLAAAASFLLVAGIGSWFAYDHYYVAPLRDAERAQDRLNEMQVARTPDPDGNLNFDFPDDKTTDMTLAEAAPLIAIFMRPESRKTFGIDLSNTQVSDVAPLSALIGLRQLDISFTQVSDLTPLSGLMKLQMVNVSMTPVVDLTPLSALTGLQQLVFHNTEVRDLAPLSALTELRFLYIPSTEVRDLAPLSTLTGLRSLFVASTRVTDLAPLSALIELRDLDISFTPVSDLEPLSTLTDLESLNVSGTEVVDLTLLSALSGLQTLFISYTPVGDLAPLSELTGLQRIYANGTQVANLAPLAPLKSLQALVVSETQVSDLAAVSALSELRELDVSMTAASDLAPLSTLTGLRELSVRETQVSDLAPLAALTGLQTLNISRTRVRDLAPLSALTGLRLLNVAGSQVADLTPLSTLTNLQELDITDAPITNLDPVREIRGLTVTGGPARSTIPPLLP